MIGTYLKLGMTALGAAGLLTKVIIALGLAGSLLAAYGIWHHRVYQSGADAAIAGIAREDAKWLGRALKARGKWQECRDQNRDWDQTTGRCL